MDSNRLIIALDNFEYFDTKYEADVNAIVFFLKNKSFLKRYDIFLKSIPDVNVKLFYYDLPVITFSIKYDDLTKIDLSMIFYFVIGKGEKEIKIDASVINMDNSRKILFNENLWLSDDNFKCLFEELSKLYLNARAFCLKLNNLYL